jgi:hypothetical protein
MGSYSYFTYISSALDKTSPLTRWLKGAGRRVMDCDTAGAGGEKKKGRKAKPNNNSICCTGLDAKV